MARLVELAETLQCAVIDNAGRMNFPSRHPLNMSFRRGPVLAQADVILALEMNDLWGTLNEFSDRIERTPPAGDQERRQGHHARHARSLHEVELPRLRALHRTSTSPSPATARRRCPPSTEQVKRLIDEGRKSAFASAARSSRTARLAMIEQAKSDATLGWDASPITTARHVRRGLCADQGRGLVAGRQRDPQCLAASAVGHQEALSVERRLRRRGHRLQPAGLDRAPRSPTSATAG